MRKFWFFAVFSRTERTARPCSSFRFRVFWDFDRAIALELLLLHTVRQKGDDSFSKQIKEAGNGKIPSIIQWGRGSEDRQRDAPRLLRDADDRGVLEPVRRADMRRHGGLREEQRGVSAPIHASGARFAQPRHVLATVLDDRAGAVREGAVAVRSGLGEYTGGGGRPADCDRRQGTPAHLLARRSVVVEQGDQRRVVDRRPVGVLSQDGGLHPIVKHFLRRPSA